MPIPQPILDLMRQAPRLNEMGLDAFRASFSERTENAPRLPYKGRVEDLTVQTARRNTPVRLYTPEADAPLPLLVYFHGGGMIFGGLGYMDGPCRYMSEAVPCTVLSVDYGLAPEHKFPQAPEECYEVLRWARANAAKLGIDPERIAVAGDSAGGNLSAVLCQMAKARGEFSPVHQVLFYPWIDLATDPAERVNAQNDIPLNAADLRMCSELYLNDRSEAKDPMASPLYAPDLTGLPPATIITEGRDPLEQEGVAYGKRLLEAGVPVAVLRFENMVHGFLEFIGLAEEAGQALDFAALRLRAAFGE